MASFVGGIANTIQGVFESFFAVVQAFFNVIASLFSGVFTFVWGLLETVGNVIGASAQFVYANFIVIGIIALVYICYQDRAKRGAKADRPRKKTI